MSGKYLMSIDLLDMTSVTLSASICKRPWVKGRNLKPVS